jgi:hypothetical protein
VADSNPAAAYDETLAKAAGFLAALNQPRMDTDEQGLLAVKSSGLKQERNQQRS